MWLDRAVSSGRLRGLQAPPRLDRPPSCLLVSQVQAGYPAGAGGAESQGTFCGARNPQHSWALSPGGARAEGGEGSWRPGRPWQQPPSSPGKVPLATTPAAPAPACGGN